MRKAYLPLLFLLFTGGAYAQTIQDYIRYRPGVTPQDGELQIAVESFTLRGITVDLYGVVHMADRAYFQQVQRDLNRYDVVLYEGVKRGTEPNVETKGLNLIQQGMAKILDLEFQMKEIDYSGPNMVHADIDLETLQEKLGDQQLSPLDGLFTPEQIRMVEPLIKTLGDFLDSWLESNQEMRVQLKSQFAEQLSSSDIEAQLPPDMKKAIIDDRNDIVMNALGETLRDPTKRRIAIFYGAGHNPDFARRMLAAGWERGEKTWKTAWRIGRGASDTPERPRREETPEVTPAPVPPVREGAGAR